ncbi:MAG TPA: class II aldolase/adducin family protein [Casimicrobiaceae bacterium]|nr:class II aldolase/adducin family protein [Casimicrobiaceae bacterium]
MTPPGPADETTQREALVAAARAMSAADINRGTAGNLSVRLDAAAFLVTPTGMRYEDLAPRDIVRMTLDGQWTGAREPSSEWRFHRDLYATRRDTGAIVHTHGPFSAALACHERGIPAFHYLVARAGGRDIRCAPYATFGTQALSDHALAALEGRRACLLAHHGAIAVGATLGAALDLARDVETLAEMYWRTLAIGEPPHLSDEEMDVVLAKFTTYGQQ